MTLMPQPSFLALLVPMLVVCAWGGFSREATADTPATDTPATDTPNIIVFLADDLGWGDLGCYGHERIQSPNLDRFAKEGLRLTQCYSACSVCSPSRSAILTGRTPYRNGVWRWIPEGSEYHLRTSEITIAEILRDKGYDTCHAGKWHLNGKFNSDEQPQPDDHGYDHWLATQNNAAPHHLNPTNFVRNGTAVGEIDGTSSMICANEVIAWLKSREDAKRPFFVTLWTHEPHLPIESAEEYQRPYADIEDPDQRQHHGNVTQLDAAFGTLMSAVDELGYRDNTLVIFTSDNGPEGDGLKGRTRGSTGGLRGRKRHSHEGGIRVPGLVRWPGKVTPETESPTPIIGSDIYSTISEIVGAPLPEDRTIDGASFLPMFRGEPITRTQPLYWRNHLAPVEYRVAMREGDWKIVAADDLSTFELYNIQQDWQETADLSAQHPEKFQELKQKLIQHDAEVLAEGPDWWKHDKQFPRRNQGVKVPKDRSKFHLFLLAGQSNMAGRGRIESQDFTRDPRIVCLDETNTWQIAVDPLHFDKPKVVGVGLAKSFAVDYAKAHPGVTVGLIPCAAGGSPIDSWQPGGYHDQTKSHPYDDAIARTKLAMKDGVLMGILWHQGESDSKPELSETYATKLQQLVERFRQDLGENSLPFVAGQLGQFPERDENEHRKRVNESLRSLPNRVPNTAFVSSDRLVHGGDGVHFDSASLREFGRRYFAALESMVHASTGPKDVARPVTSRAVSPTYSNVAYGEHERNVLDFWQAAGDGPRPLLVFIHGGGWTTGDKARKTSDVKPYLDRGISYASINYRLTPQSPLPAPVHDAARAIQFLRSKAEQWNIRVDRIVLTGGSAGACTSMWLLCHDDLADAKSGDPVARESTRVTAAAVSAGQTSIDPQVIEPWLGPMVLQHRMINMAVGELKIDQALANYEKHKSLFVEFSPYNHVTSDDPPLWMSYTGETTLPSKNAGHGIHHPVYGIKMKEKCDAVGQECHLVINGEATPPQFPTAESFILAKLLE